MSALGREGPMRITRKILIGLLLIIGVVIGSAIAWWHFSFPTASYRYRLSVAVEVDGQVHSASSVIEVRYRFNPHWAAALIKWQSIHIRRSWAGSYPGPRGTRPIDCGTKRHPRPTSRCSTVSSRAVPFSRSQSKAADGTRLHSIAFAHFRK